LFAVDLELDGQLGHPAVALPRSTRGGIG
jgi:hypothetical protein